MLKFRMKGNGLDFMTGWKVPAQVMHRKPDKEHVLETLAGPQGPSSTYIATISTSIAADMPRLEPVD